LTTIGEQRTKIFKKTITFQQANLPLEKDQDKQHKPEKLLLLLLQLHSAQAVATTTLEQQLQGNTVSS
jgi:hypothetical protein